MACGLTYLVSVCAWLQLFQFVVQHGELPSDALYPSVQTSVFAVLGVEIILIPLPLLGRADHFILPGTDGGRFGKKGKTEEQKINLSIAVSHFPNLFLDHLGSAGQRILHIYSGFRETVLTINTRPLLVLMMKKYWCCCTFHLDLKNSTRLIKLSPFVGQIAVKTESEL